MSLASTVPIACESVWKIFGPAPERARQQLEEGASRDEVMADGHVAAVQDVSFEVARGETFVVMGLSGSGKSTLVRCASRLIEPTAGRVLIDGDDICQAPDEELRQIRRHKLGMVFQHFGLFPHRRVIDNVAYGLEVQGIAKSERYERSRDVLEMVGLTGWGEHYPQQLSGGMQQRVGLARALCVDPEILFFDEPFSALDPLIRREMQDELIRLQDFMQRTLVFITHDFLEALKLGDKIAIMKEGRFVQVGTPEEVVGEPVDDYVREFTKDVPKGKVLSVRSVMIPLGDGPAPPGLDGRQIETTTSLDEVLPLVLDTEEALPVADETGRVVGTVTRRQVVAALSDSPP